jgi:hypothetical protein
MALYLNIIKKRVGGDDSVAVQKKRGGAVLTATAYRPITITVYIHNYTHIYGYSGA